MLLLDISQGFSPANSQKAGQFCYTKIVKASCDIYSVIFNRKTNISFRRKKKCMNKIQLPGCIRVHTV